MPSAGKVELLGAQDEVIYLDFSTQHVAGLGIDQQAVLQSLQAQNAVAPSGVIAGRARAGEPAGQRPVHLGGEPARHQPPRQRPLLPPEPTSPPSRRGYVDPPQPMFRFNGQPAIGLAIGMKPNGNLLQFGEDLRERMREIVGDLPIGVGVHLVSNQPAVVEEAVGGFTKALFEAVVIVLVRQLPQPRPARRPGGRDRRSRWCSPSPSCSWSIPASRCSASRSAR